MKSFIIKPKAVKYNWYIIDATDKTLGRLATKLVHILRGKHKIEYTPHVNMGDYIIVLNAKKIVVTGNKYFDKIYYHHTGYAGSIKKMSFKEMIIRCPEKVIKIAVKGMLPKGPLGRILNSKIKVYAGNKHNHIAQKPKCLDI